MRPTPSSAPIPMPAAQALSPQPLMPAHWTALQCLLQSVHRRDTPESYPAEYPLMLGPQGQGTSFGILDEKGQVLSHVGILRRTLEWKTWRLRVALIGSVATSPKSEGLGLASKTLAAVHQQLKREGVTLTFLWSDSRPLYQRLGYHPVGRALLFKLPHMPPPTVHPHLRLVALTSADHTAIMTLPKPAYCTFERTNEEYKRLLTIPNTQLWGYKHDNRLLAALAIGKGSDLSDICHEYWGDEALILPLLRGVQQQLCRPLGLLVPDLPDILLQHALQLGLEATEMPEAQGCVLDEERLRTALSTLVPLETTQALEALKGSWREEESLLTTLLGPRGARRWGGLPLPFHAWGLDSN